ncbi:PhoH-like protein [Candidatus Phycosocius bacilliformis]|uniref:Endoribonuclease YbeY n=1 Tax=Candidatus Phycosocius bacilliformis TaxID=1445552 RepID=A0A2P2EDQ1_9PROT|nr:PhoH-like protein [Candidatus Phycosocius bacilliformis]
MTRRRKAEEGRVALINAGLVPLVAGPAHRNLTLVEEAFGVDITAQGGDILIHGDDPVSIQHAHEALQALIEKAEAGGALSLPDVRSAITFVRAGTRARSGALALPGRRADIKPRTPTQAIYLDALMGGEFDLVFGVGPAGTGKTFLAVAVGVAMLLEGRVSRVVVTRPAVEAGERLGFLPGDLEEKVDPYLQPIWDAFKMLLGAAQLERRKAAGEIEVAPLAFMRGRTLSDAFVIVDEAQNTTRMQMKMLLTRLGEGSRMAVNGDPSQIDLPRAAESGLPHALRILRRVEGMKTVHFSAEDVVRHPLVGRIVAAYERDSDGPTPERAEKPVLSQVSFAAETQVDSDGWAGVFGSDIANEVQNIVTAVAGFFEPSVQSVAVLLTDDARVQALNAQWRQQDKPTNVLSFPAAESLSDISLAGEIGLGDIALAYETCAREAAEQGKSLKHHATHLLVHGLLHLLGYDHEADDDAAEMEGLEREILASLGIADPYQTHD